MRRLWAMAAVMVLAGCSGASPEKLAKFQSGKTTLPQVIASLGRPTGMKPCPTVRACWSMWSSAPGPNW